MALPKYFHRHPIYPNNLPPLRSNTLLTIVIPSFKEESLPLTLESLLNCETPEFCVDVIVVNNLPIGSPTEEITRQEDLSKSVIAFNSRSASLQFHVVNSFDLDVRELGAGLARKIGMDIAAYRYYVADFPYGIIVGLDADCIVDSNYLCQIGKSFAPKSIIGASIYFEHPLSGDLPLVNYEAIIQYELHLRYYNLMLRYLNFPKAFHTVGSSFAVRAEAYVKAGGMTKRIAGEDFYFIQKVLAIQGEYIDILSTTVRPSPRLSSRVLFGTGAAVTKYVTNNQSCYFTYDTDAFLNLGSLFKRVTDFWLCSDFDYECVFEELHFSLGEFITKHAYISDLCKVHKTSKSVDVFRNQFFAVFDSLFVVKYLNYVHEQVYEKMPVDLAASNYLKLINSATYPKTAADLLLLFRSIEQSFYLK